MGKVFGILLSPLYMAIYLVLCSSYILKTSFVLASPLMDEMEDVRRNNLNLSKLELRQSRKKALETLGPEDKKEVYLLPNGKRIEFYFYRTAVWNGGGVREDRLEDFMPVAFDEEHLVGFGYPYYYKDVVRQGVRSK